MSPEKHKILLFASEKFFQEGFNKVSMDELAKEMKISKKTIYKHFSSKNEIVVTTVETLKSNLRRSLDQIIIQESTSISKLIQISRTLLRVMFKVSDAWLNDLRSYSPELWNGIEEFRSKTFMSVFGSILDQGKVEGLIIERPNVITLTTMMGGIRSVINPSFLLNNKFSAKEAGEICLDIVITGILTAKGRKNFNKSKMELNNEKI